MTTNKYHFFWSGPLSQWHSSVFEIDSVSFTCAEQYMMYVKAILFEDQLTANNILNAKHPRNQKALGRLVKDFDQEIWDSNKEHLVFIGTLAKFKQNPYMLKTLLLTEDLEIVEASPYDKIWGIGMDIDHPNILDKSKWLGENLLGKVLMKVRNELKEPLTEDLEIYRV